MSVTVKYGFEILFSQHGNLFFPLPLVCVFAVFVVPRAVDNFEAGITNLIFCKEGAVIWALAFANAIDLNVLCSHSW